MTHAANPNRPAILFPLVLLGVATAGLLWAFWATLGEMAQRWSHDPQYSHGYLVPGFALALLWLRRHHLAAGPLRPSLWGVPLLGAGLTMRLVGGYYYFAWVDAISLLPCLAGLAVLIAGRPAARWAGPAIAFLAFMIPLPYSAEVAMAQPLQRFATLASTFALQTLGLPAVSEGNVILLNEVEIGIVEACSGLRMLVIFFALSTGVALVIRRRLWEKIVLVASAFPIALLVNVVRITATGVLHDMVSSRVANAVFHDLAGWLMMPLALILLGIELKYLKHLLIEPAPVGPVPLTYGLGRPRGGASRGHEGRSVPRVGRQPDPVAAGPAEGG